MNGSEDEHKNKIKFLTLSYFGDIYKIKHNQRKRNFLKNQNKPKNMYGSPSHLAALEHNLQVRQEKHRHIQSQFVSKSWNSMMTDR